MPWLSDDCKVGKFETILKPNQSTRELKQSRFISSELWRVLTLSSACGRFTDTAEEVFSCPRSSSKIEIDYIYLITKFFLANSVYVYGAKTAIF